MEWQVGISIFLLICTALNLFVSYKNLLAKEIIRKEAKELADIAKKEMIALIEDKTEDKMIRREFDTEMKHVWRELNKKADR